MANEFPLALAQERLWFVEQLDPGSPLHHMAGAVHLDGPLDHEALARSLRAVTDRHETLRTSFAARGASTVQRIHATAAVELVISDHTDDGTLGDELRREARAPFDLAAPGLLRVRLLRFGPSEHVLVVVIHHLICDGWSIGILLRELVTHYEGFVTGHGASVEPLQIQYADYAVWQRSQVTDGAIADGLTYWTKQLGDAPARSLPERSASDSTDRRGAIASLSLGGELAAALRALARCEGATMFTTLLAGLHVMLAQSAAQRDVVVGSPVSERQAAETHGLIGLFVNVIALRGRLDRGTHFRELIRATRATVHAAQRHQDVPFEILVRALERDTPLVQVAFGWGTGLAAPVVFGAARGRIEAIHTGTAKFDLTLTLDDTGTDIVGTVEYRMALYDADAIDAWCQQLIVVLRALVAAPDAPIGDLDLLAVADHARQEAWSHGAPAAPSGNVLAELARHVSERPGAIALEQGDRAVSFGSLARSAERLRTRLASCGVGRHTVVGICSERSIEAVIAMVAILQTGAAYLPLDAAYPADRIRAMIADAGVSVVCSDGSLRDQLGTDVALVEVAVDATGAGAPPTIHAAIDPAQLAYVIYTSGSTGRPKGVENTHRGLHNLCAWHRSSFELAPGHRTTQFAALGFDASTWEIWASLTSGATLCFVPPEARLVAEELRDWLVEQRIASCFLPTPMAEAVLRIPWRACSLRWLLAGGDRLTCWAPDVPFAVINLYGPTEATVVSTSGVVPRSGSTAAPTIGRAISGMQVYVLDRELRHVPAGSIGELYIGGEGVARGYRGRAALTAQQFIPDPFSKSPGARLYRTGDLGWRVAATGEIVFSGRVDAQLKLRGHRIEPAEIEAVMREVDGVTEAAVLVTPGETPRLVGFVALVAGASPTTLATLREHTRARLPAFMVPSQLVEVAALPLTVNGKLDRAALLAQVEGVASREIVQRTATEDVLAAIWSSLLGGAEVSPDASFFELGGHSLLAAQMIVRVREAFGRAIPLRLAFDCPVLRDLAAYLDDEASDAAALTIPVVERRDRMALSSAQQRLWFLDRFTGSKGAYNISGAVRFTGALDRDALARSLNNIVERHEVLRSSFGTDAGVPYAQFHRDITIAMPVTVLRNGDELDETLRSEAAVSFDLERPAPIRVRLFQLAADDHALLVVIHHIVADGWSIGILVRELQQAYAAHVSAQAPQLPTLAIQYADYAAWQCDRLAHGALATGISYWKRQLAGAPPFLELPGALPRDAADAYGGGTLRRELPATIVEALRELGRRADATLFMTLYAGIAALLSRLTGQTDVVVGTDMADRGHLGVEPLIGMFVNQLVLRTDASGDPTFCALLARVRPVVLDAWAHQDVPFATLVEELRPPRALGRNPLFQAMVILQGTAPDVIELAGLRGELLELEPVGSVFDLTFAFATRATGAITTTLRHAASVPQPMAERLLADLHQLLGRAAFAPETCLSAFEVHIPMADKPTSRVRHRPRLEDLRRSRVAAPASSELVTMRALDTEDPLPLVIEPTRRDVDLASWAQAHRDQIQSQLVRSGGVLFRGFTIETLENFRHVVRAVFPETIVYGERSSPRSQLLDGVYTSTDHPPDQPILLHNEQSYTLSWPRQIWFYCAQPACSGGRTPIADSRRILARLSRTTVEQFASRGVMYMRNYGDGLGLSWPEAFQTTERAQVEEHCRRAGIRVEWKDEHRLRTFQVRPALRCHPQTGEATWFNHLLFFHITSLPPHVRDSIIAGVLPEDLPFNTFYGDGAPIERQVLDEIRAAYEVEKRSFQWQRGDILVLDNMLTAHGREPFAGARQIAVAMTEPFTAIEPTR